MDDNRFSPTHAVIGLAGLAVAIWGLAGAPAVTDSGALRWGAISVAILIGVALIVVGGLANRDR